jgi:hypothetical protein
MGLNASPCFRGKWKGQPHCCLPSEEDAQSILFLQLLQPLLLWYLLMVFLALLDAKGNIVHTRIFWQGPLTTKWIINEPCHLFNLMIDVKLLGNTTCNQIQHDTVRKLTEIQAFCSIRESSSGVTSLDHSCVPLGSCVSTINQNVISILSCTSTLLP